MDYNSQYLTQLKDGCINPECSKIFCKKALSTSIIEALSTVLSKYEGVFLCNNFNVMLEDYQEAKKWCDMKIPVLDFFFNFLSEILQNCTKQTHNVNLKNKCNDIIFDSKKTEEEDDCSENLDAPFVECLKTGKILFEHIVVNPRDEETVDAGASSSWEGQKKSVKPSSIMQINESFKRIDLDKNAHSYCEYLKSEELTDIEIAMLCEVVQIILKMYEIYPYQKIGCVALRLYRIVTRHCSLEPRFYTTLHKIVENISIEFEKTKQIPTNTDSTCSSCINPTNHVSFDSNDFVYLIETISCYLNSTRLTDIRNNKNIEDLLKIFCLLYSMNLTILAVSNKKFYLNTFCSRMDLYKEIKYFRSNKKTLLNFPFILSVHTKAELIKRENTSTMESSMRDSFFRSLFEGPIVPYLFITVSRTDIYEDSKRLFSDTKMTNINLRKPLRITFKNEEGVDSGGIQKEYFQLLCQEIKLDVDLFETLENRLWLKPVVGSKSTFKSIGMILGLALYNGVVLDLPFPSLFFKKLLNETPTFNDLKEIQPEIFTSLCNLKKLDPVELADLDIDFTVQYSNGSVYDLISESHTKVTKENLKLFIDEYIKFYTTTVIEEEFNALKSGFYSVLEPETLTYVNHIELEKIIMGLNTFDIKAIKSTTTYSGYDSTSPMILYFWELFENYSRGRQKKLLQFITGNDRIPVSGSSSLKLTITKNDCDTDRLPTAQTCFNTLVLPEYTSKEQLEKKLTTALDMTAGFYLI